MLRRPQGGGAAAPRPTAAPSAKGDGGGGGVGGGGGGTPAGVHPVLVEGLAAPTKRTMVLKFEEALLVMVRSPDQLQLDFPPLGPYQRLVLQHLADRFGLGCTAVGVAVPVRTSGGGWVGGEGLVLDCPGPP